MSTATESKGAGGQQSAWQAPPGALGGGVRVWLCQSVLKGTRHIRLWGSRVLWASPGGPSWLQGKAR